jgi:LPXTG-motif cell wall-anchored protein
MSKKSRVGRVLAASVLAGAILAGPLGLSQAGAAGLSSFSAQGTGYALRVSVDLSGLAGVAGVGSALNTLWTTAGQTGSFPLVIDQYLVKSTTDGDNKLTKAVSVLGEGFTNFGGANATASTVGTSKSVTVAASKLPSDALPLVDLAVGLLNAAVANGPVVNGDGSLVRVSASLKDIMAGLGAAGVDLSTITTSLDSLLAQVNGSTGLLTTLEDTIAGGLAQSAVDGVAPVTSSLTSLPTVGPTIGGILGGSSTPTEQVTQITDTLTSVLNLTALPNIFDTDLASINGLVNKAVAMKKNGVAVADASSSLKSISILGGFIKAGVLNLASHSEAAGVAGSAKNTSSCSIADVKLGGTNGVSLDGKTVFINGSPVELATNLVASVKGVIDQVLSVLGTSVKLCDVAQKSADLDGTAAAQRVSALRVDIAPSLPGLGQLVHVIVDPTVETSVAARVVSPVKATSKPNLPKTGAGMLATVIVGSALAFGALVFRRRFV